MEALQADLARIEPFQLYGRLCLIRGALIAFRGPRDAFSMGTGIVFKNNQKATIQGEVIGFRDGLIQAMAYGGLDGIQYGTRIYRDESRHEIFPSNAWLGRTINGLAEPIDGLGLLNRGVHAMSLKASPPAPALRQPLGEPIDVGVRAMNCFTTMCHGQRLGIFAGSGVGKSVLLSMLAKGTKADVIVLGLIGERGREVREFITEHLGAAGLRRSVVVVATSDEAALMRSRAALVSMSVAEYFRDQGKSVLLIMDSITRYAMALREIGLVGGEPPATRGYPPSVFAELPRLLERAGPGENKGTISALFSVLVEGEDLNEPISDTVRGILDGHIVLERDIGQRGRYPAINILKSISRTMPHSTPIAMREIIAKARALMARYEDMQELIRMGVYRAGSHSDVDEAISLRKPLEAFLSQSATERASFEEDYAFLAQILNSSGEA